VARAALSIPSKHPKAADPETPPAGVIRFPENDGDSGCRQTEVDGRVRRSEKRQAFSGTVLLVFVAYHGLARAKSVLSK
jgi:hypothetical protein